ncbi:MAG: Asp-tRNA(Asn)/Glu-tRNA(Gln) amidotransferase subunit GatB [Acidobacteriota bacterium]
MIRAPSPWEPVIGLEVHVQLRTETKIFCRCPHRFGAAPNTQVCEVCLGYPGALPVLNRAAVDQAVLLSVALYAEVRDRSTFARKSYFYPDSPKGYQISQHDRPLAERGALPLARHGRAVPIERLHLEEDAAKLSRSPDPAEKQDRLDFNRSGVPLVEIVSAPALRSPAEAHDYLQTLHRLLRYTGTSDANMEEGSLRCDANVSIRPKGSAKLGTRTEIKNLNSFRHVARALHYEIERHIRVVEGGGRIASETRAWDGASGTTRRLRPKEGPGDYRYFPDPDLPPVRVDRERIRRARASLPELPWRRRERLAATFGLSREDAFTLTSKRELADYFEATVAFAAAPAGDVANWIRGDVLRELKDRGHGIDRAPTPEAMAQLVDLVHDGTVSSIAGKRLLGKMWRRSEAPRRLAAEMGLLQVRDGTRLEAWARGALEGQAPQIALYRGGKDGLLGYFVGRGMGLSGGKADPKALARLLRSILDGENT